MSQPLRVLLVDDHVLFRQGVLAALAIRPDVEVVGEASDGLEALALTREKRPDAIFMDLGMPRCDGLEATRQIKREMPKVKIIVLTISDDDESLFQAIKAGAEGYLLKNLKAHHLFDAIDNLVQGGAPLSGKIAARILHEFQHASAASGQELPLVDPLSAREIEILQLLARGLSNGEISTALVISESTVKNHVRSILGKLHLKNRVEAAVYAVRAGLLNNE